ncbi:MAG: PHP domain-containing protein [Gemmatimonadota bacterium]
MAGRHSWAPGSCGIVHVHSEFSHDGRDSLEGLRDFALEREISFIGLTDHAEDFDAGIYEAYSERCQLLSDDRVRLVPGLEFRFEGFPGLHLLALGLRSWISPATPAEFASQAPGLSGFTIVAHPVLPAYQVPAEVLATIDAIEVWNAAYNTRYLPDPRSMRLLHAAQRNRPEIVGTAGLDQHDARNDRETRVILLRPGAPDPLAELRAGRFTNAGRTMRFGSAVKWGPARLASLTGIRVLYDLMEGMQERVARALSARRRSRH